MEESTSNNSALKELNCHILKLTLMFFSAKDSRLSCESVYRKRYSLAFVNSIDQDLHCLHITYIILLEDTTNLCIFWLELACQQDDPNLHRWGMSTFSVFPCAGLYSVHWPFSHRTGDSSIYTDKTMALCVMGHAVKMWGWQMIANSFNDTCMYV